MMQQRDQDARQAAMSATNRDTGVIADDVAHRLLEVDRANLVRLKQIIAWDGFPSVAMVGVDGVEAAWLITQHAASDLPFQRRILRVLARRVDRGEVSDQDYALLLDRVLVFGHQLQRYGTQFRTENGHVVEPFPIADPAHVDARRRGRGLIPLADYACLLHADDAFYDLKRQVEAK